MDILTSGLLCSHGRWQQNAVLEFDTVGYRI